MRATTFGIAIAAILVACDTTDSESSQAPPLVTEVAAAEQEAWEALGLEGYRIRYEWRNVNGMGGSPGDGVYDVTVRDGHPVRCTLSEGYLGDEGPCYGGGMWGVDPVAGLHTFVRVRQPESGAVRWDPALRFPEWILFDEPGVMDEEILIVVHDFEPLE